MDILHTNKKLSLGARGEKAASNYLKRCGYQILATNFCNTKGRRIGEIDIVAKDGQEVVFVEVKTRMSSKYNIILPEENITRSKLYKVNKAANFYLSKNKLTRSPYRFDAITLLVDETEDGAKLRHLKNIFF